MAQKFEFTNPQDSKYYQDTSAIVIGELEAQRGVTQETLDGILNKVRHPLVALVYDATVRKNALTPEEIVSLKIKMQPKKVTERN